MNNAALVRRETGVERATAPSPTTLASTLIEDRVEQGWTLERIEAEVLRKQHSIVFDLPAPHHFWSEGLKKESDRIRRLVSFYVKSLMMAEEQVGVRVFSEDVETFPFGKNDLWLPPEASLISRRWFVRSRSFDDLWSIVELVAYSVVWKVIRMYRLDSGFFQWLVQEARIAAWNCQRTFNGGCKFTTYAHRAFELALGKAVRKELLAPDPTDDVVPSFQLDDNMESQIDWLTIKSLLSEEPDAPNLLLHVAGYEDSEIPGSNTAVRRHRIRARLKREFAFS